MRKLTRRIGVRSRRPHGTRSRCAINWSKVHNDPKYKRVLITELANRKPEIKLPGDHGTYSRIVSGCGCRICREAYFHTAHMYL